MKERTFIELVRDMPLFTSKQVKALVGGGRYSKVFLYRLVERGLIRRLNRGFYTVHEDPVIYSTHVYYPSYISLWYAFQHHGTTTQLPKSIEVMAPESNAIEGVEFIKTRNLWGYQTIKYRGFEISMADLEKAILDAVTTERIPLDEIQIAIRQSNKKKLEQFALKTDISTMKKIGYLTEASGHFMKNLNNKIKGDRNYVCLHGAKERNRWRVVDD